MPPGPRGPAGADAGLRGRPRIRIWIPQDIGEIVGACRRLKEREVERLQKPLSAANTPLDVAETPYRRPLRLHIVTATIVMAPRAGGPNPAEHRQLVSLESRRRTSANYARSPAPT